jgi:hypothetical protein
MLHTSTSTSTKAPAYHSPRANGSQAASPAHAAMIESYRSAGGLVTSDRAAVLLRPYRDQPISQLARWIVARHIVSFEFEGDRLVPLFQFELDGMLLRPHVRDVVSELVGAFEDDLDVATWFTRPNCWLRWAVPLVMLESDPAEVLQAARADRFLARA